MKPVLTSLLIVVATLIPAAAEDRHLFILSGQSNMVRMKPETGFLLEAEKLFPEAKIETIKVATGGKPIRNWLVEWDDLAKEAGLDPAAIRAEDKVKGSPYFESILAKAKPLLDPRPTSITFVWMQGESDAKQSAS